MLWIGTAFTKGEDVLLQEKSIIHGLNCISGEKAPECVYSILTSYLTNIKWITHLHSISQLFHHPTAPLPSCWARKQSHNNSHTSMYLPRESKWRIGILPNEKCQTSWWSHCGSRDVWPQAIPFSCIDFVLRRHTTHEARNRRSRWSWGNWENFYAPIFSGAI